MQPLNINYAFTVTDINESGWRSQEPLGLHNNIDRAELFNIEIYDT
jgi:hypothetical protein